MKGTILFFTGIYGFVKSDEPKYSNDLYFYYRDISDNCRKYKKGDRVTFVYDASYGCRCVKKINEFIPELKYAIINKSIYNSKNKLNALINRAVKFNFNNIICLKYYVVVMNGEKFSESNFKLDSEEPDIDNILLSQGYEKYVLAPRRRN